MDIILFALREEAPNIFKSYYNVFEIGVGKVNAALNTMKLIKDLSPSRVILFGTAGSVTLGTGIYRVGMVKEHDVNLIDLGVEPGVQLNDKFSRVKISDNNVICASGDLFVTESDKLRVLCDMVDMEAFSVAKACAFTNTRLEIWKYITDNANVDASEDWNDNVSAGEKSFEDVLSSLNIPKRTAI